MTALLLLLACSGGTPADGPADGAATASGSGSGSGSVSAAPLVDKPDASGTMPDADAPTLAVASSPSATRDGVELKVDLYASPQEGGAGVILLHMIPPSWDRTSWPSDFIDGLRERGWSVCVPDRRGAGESAGVAEEAYTGENGRYDVEVCVKQLKGVGAGDLAVLGASNGTTSMVDYAVWAQETTDEKLPKIKVLGFMTGGTYTEKQTAMDKVTGIPAIFTYSTEEKAWSAAQKGKSELWEHVEYPGGDHGTKMFAAKPDVTDDLYAFLETHLIE